MATATASQQIVTASRASTIEAASIMIVIVRYIECSIYIGICDYLICSNCLNVLCPFPLCIHSHHLKKNSLSHVLNQTTLPPQNPPDDARDPLEWKQFFETTFMDSEVQVRACTIALDNQELIKALIRRWKLILQLNNMSPEELDTDEMDKFVASCPPTPGWKKVLCKVICCGQKADPNEIYAAIQQEDVNIYNLSRKVYNVAGVFVTFETESSQRAVLSQLARPGLIAGPVYDYYKFKDVVLDVSRTEEPDSIRWQDLNVSLKVS